MQFIAFQGTHDIVLKRITQDDKDEIKVNGIKLYGFCSGFVNTIKSFFNTLKAFYGGLGFDPNAKNPKFRPSVQKDMERANLRVLELFNHYTPERRNNTIVNFDKNIVKSGDAIVISRMESYMFLKLKMQDIGLKLEFKGLNGMNGLNGHIMLISMWLYYL